MPMKLGHHNMIPTPNAKGVLVIGGTEMMVEDCQWVTLQHKLRFARKAFVAMLIPDSLANELCL